MDRRAEHDLAGSTVHRIRGVLAIPAFRRLWGVTAITAVAEWQSLLALSALATHLTSGYQAQSFALGGVVATKLLPALVLGPLAGALADKLDRRYQMVICDVGRAGLFLSIPLVGELTWLFVATFLIELCALFWIPAKDASIPNLLRRSDQVETANQLSLFMTYGAAVLVGAGVFSALSKLGPVIPGPEGPAYLALSINGVAYACCALVVGTRIPEISGRALIRRNAQPGLLAMLRDGVVFVRGTPLVRGLVTGILGAFAAGGAVIACAKLYATSLGGGDAAYGLLFASLFVGLGGGMALAPLAARRVWHRGLFGLAIISAGIALVAVALAPHLYVALVAVILVGAAAGVAFLTGVTIIGAQVADEMRGRTIAFVQSLVRLDLLASMAMVPLAVGLVQQRNVELFREQVTIDGTRPVLLCAGLLAALIGVLAHRQMDDRLDGSLLSDLRAALHRSRPGDRV
jgi:dTMP kinase